MTPTSVESRSYYFTKQKRHSDVTKYIYIFVQHPICKLAKIHYLQLWIWRTEWRNKKYRKTQNVEYSTFKTYEVLFWTGSNTFIMVNWKMYVWHYKSKHETSLKNCMLNYCRFHFLSQNISLLHTPSKYRYNTRNLWHHKFQRSRNSFQKRFKVCLMFGWYYFQIWVHLANKVCVEHYLSRLVDHHSLHVQCFCM